jgi:hypothetical protein
MVFDEHEELTRGVQKIYSYATTLTVANGFKQMGRGAQDHDREAREDQLW